MITEPNKVVLMYRLYSGNSYVGFISVAQSKQQIGVWSNGKVLVKRMPEAETAPSCMPPLTKQHGLGQ